MRRRVWLGLFTATVAIVLAVSLRGKSLPSYPAPDALPAAKAGAAMSVNSPKTRGGALVTLHIETPGPDLLYGSRVDVDEKTPKGWVNHYAVGADMTQPDPTAGVLHRTNPKQFWTLEGHFGAEDRLVRLPKLRRGVYRFRTGFVIRQPNDASAQFELAVSFTVE